MQHGDVQLNRRPPRLSNQAGISLIEVLVASVLGLAVLGTINAFSQFQLFSLRNQAVQSGAQMNVRSVSDVFARDVRRAGFNPTCAANAPAIDYAKPKELRLNSDLNGDGALSGTNEVLTYRLVMSSSGDRFERVANGRTDILMDRVDLSTSLFRYFDSTGAEVDNGLTGLTNSEKDDVRRIRLELVVDADPVDPDRSLPMRVRLANDVEIRNRHFVNSISCP